MQLDGTNALVTGASSGIGRAVAVELARRGARVALVARDAAALRDTASEICARHGHAVVLPADLSRRHEAAAVARWAIDALGAVDILVNNAGVQIFGPVCAAGDGDAARALMETNFFAPLALASALVPGMRERGTGCVVQVSSLAATMPTPLSGHYSASKAALGNATEAMRCELRGTSVQVLHVIPGPVDTPMLAEGRAIAAEIFDGTPRGSAAELARRIADGIEAGRRTLVYPWWALVGRLLPTLATAIARYVFRRLEFDPARVIQAGSRGADAVRVERRRQLERAAPDHPDSIGESLLRNTKRRIPSCSR